MKYFRKNNINSLKKALTIIFIFILYVLSHREWYLTFFPITGGDVGFVYQDYFLNLLSTIAPTWNSFLNFGSNSIVTINYFGFNLLGAFIAKLGFSYNIIFRGIALYPILIGFMVSTLVSGKMISKNSWVGMLTFGLVFSLNTFIIVTWTNMMVAYAFLPIIFFTLYKYLQEKKVIWILLFSLTFFISLVYEIRIGFIAFLVCFIYILYSWIVKHGSLSSFLFKVLNIIFSFIVVFLMASFIIFPLVFGKSFSAVNGITSQNLFGTDIYTLKYALSFMHPYWTGDTFIVFAQQPIKFYFWIYPILAFSALFFWNRNKNILFFSILAVLGVFMGKGAANPFGGIYVWLYRSVPFFNFFREPIEWWAIIGFSYAMLTGYFFEYCYQSLSNFFQRKKLTTVEYATKLILLIPIMLVTLSIIYPAYNGRLGNGLNSVHVPDEYALLKQNLMQDPSFYRVLSIPVMQRFVHYNANHPSVSLNNLPIGLRSLDTKLLSLENIKEVILPDDILNDVYSGQSTKEQYEHYITSSVSSPEYPPLIKKNGYGNISLFENPIIDIPHIFPVKELVYVSGTQNISDIIGLPTDKQVAYYIEEPIPNGGSKTFQNQATNTNLRMNDLATKDYIVAECVRCDLSKKYYDYVIFPYASVLPNNILYPLIIEKEKKLLNSILDPVERMKTEAYLAEKRVVEAQTMIDNKVNKPFIIQSINENTKLINDVNTIIKSIWGIENNDAFLETLDYLSLQKITYYDLSNIFIDGNIKDMMLLQVYRLSDVISHLLTKTFVTQGNDKKLLATLPNAGKFGIYVKNDPEINFIKTSLTIDNMQFVQQGSLDDQFISYGSSFFQAGRHQIEMNVFPNNLLATNSSSFTIESSNILDKTNLTISSLLDPEAKYELAFDYRVISGRSPRIFITDEAITNPVEKAIIDTNLSDEHDGQWHHYVQFFSPSYGVSKPVLHIWFYKEGDQDNQMEFKNISITKMLNPIVVFTRNTGKILDTPEISYQEINPSDYSIQIKNANKPFLLTFAEQYDSGWKIEDNSSWVPQASQVMNNYFANSIHELSIKNQIGIFTFLSNKKIYNFVHSQASGFSNIWIVDKPGNYSLSIIFTPQKYFLIGCIISALSLFFVIVAILFLIVKKYKTHK